MKRKFLAVTLVLALSTTMLLAGCGETPAPASEAPAMESAAAMESEATPMESEAAPMESTDAAAPAPGADTAGFEEFPIGPEQQVDPLNVAGVYFQPVDMEPAGMGGLPAAESDMHIEADISAIEGNDLGYGAGSFVPNLTVDYMFEKIDDGTVIEGTMMPMNATDGPHYGANVKLAGAGNYKVTFTIKSPADQNYLLHTDAETGVAGEYWVEPLVVVWDDFEFIPREW